MSGREAILGRIRRSLGVSGDALPRRAAVTDRLARAPRGVIPARGALAPAARLELFMEMARRSQATVLAGPLSGAPGAIADFLARQNLPPAVRMGSDPRLGAIPWTNFPTVEVRRGAAQADDLACVSHAEGGVAETGTLVLVSGPDNPTSLNFLPVAHIIVVDGNDVTGDAETMLAQLQSRYGKGRLPRTVNFITGPSRSGDIEQTLILGAHGPQTLLVLVVTPEA